MEVTRKTGKEPFEIGGETLPFNLLHFWQWSSSDLVGNALRGLLAEYVVATALGCATGVRVEWDAFDLETPEGTKVEVKSAAYVQSWKQEEPSRIQFGIQPTHGWNPKTNAFAPDKARQADVYVFCVLEHKDQATINPLNLDQWAFHIISAKKLNQLFGDQKTVSLGRLLENEPESVRYKEIPETIKAVVETWS